MVVNQKWSRRQFTGALGLGVAAAATGILRPSEAQAYINQSGAGGLAPPSNGSFMVPIIRKLELDKKYGLNFDINLYSDPSNLYSDLAANRTSHIFGAIYNCANFYVRGVPLQLMFTISTANHAFVSKNPAIKTAADLSGKTVAATTSSGFYGMAVLFLKQNGLDPRKNLNVINAPPSSVHTQLVAEKIEVGLLADPALSSMVSQGYHLVGDMNGGIRQSLGMAADAPVWYIGAYGHKDWIEADPKRAENTMKMWQDAAEFYNKNQDEADKIISEFTRISTDALALSRKLNLTSFRIEPAVEQKQNLAAVFRGFQEVGFLTGVPDDGIYGRAKK